MTVFCRVMGVVVLAAFGFASVAITSSDACQICLPIPKNSAADYLIEADAVVLAREDPEKPFSLRIVEVVKGEVADPSIDLFLDSTSRRILSLFPERKILCVFRKADPEPGWRRIGMTDALYESVVREILERSGGWKNAPRVRASYFAPFLGHGDDQLRTLAHIEVARAPYDEIRKLHGNLSPEKIRAFLADMRQMEWHALYILLFAQSDAEGDRERIRKSFRSASEFALTNHLPAWAMAYVEIDGGDAIASIEQRYLRNPSRKPEEIASVLAALSVHGSNGHTHLRDRIIQGYRTLLETRPELAPKLVDDLTKWGRWDLADVIGEISEAKVAGINLQGTMKLRDYLRGAAVPKEVVGQQRVEDAGRGDNMMWWVVGGVCLLALSVWLGSRGKGGAPRGART